MPVKDSAGKNPNKTNDYFNKFQYKKLVSLLNAIIEQHGKTSVKEPGTVVDAVHIHFNIVSLTQIVHNAQFVYL